MAQRQLKTGFFLNETGSNQYQLAGGGFVNETSGGGGATNYTLTADAGAYTLSGVDAVLTRGIRLTADAGAYSLTGVDAALTYTPGSGAYTLTADTGSYTLSGNDAGLTFARSMAADVGSYTLSGVDAGLVLGRSLTAETGAYALAGVDADLIYTALGPTAYTLSCESGAYSIAGQDAALQFSGAVVRRRHAGTRKNYIIKGQKYALTDYELQLHIQQLLNEVKRPEVQVVDEKEVKQISRKVWKRLKESLAGLEALTLDRVEDVIEQTAIQMDDEDDEELLLLL